MGLIGGALFTLIFATNAVNSNNSQMMGMMGMRTQNIMREGANQGMMQMHDEMMGDSDMTMSTMVESLQGKTGDNFDKTFISEMIDHHQGAIDMAKLAQQNASHQEIKDLADDIINAQTNEINMMRQWQSAWEY